MEFKDEGKYILETINYKGGMYKGECTFRKINVPEELKPCKIKFHCDFSLLMDSYIRNLELTNNTLLEKNTQRELQISEMAAYLKEKGLTDDYLKWSK